VIPTNPEKEICMSHEASTVDQNKLIDFLLEKQNLKNDAALARALDVAPPVISKIRHHRLPVGAALKLRMMRRFGVTLEKLDELAPEAA
jgi:plasmid maintenance system antidote protein VapI